jgi:DNA-directed RNA polymerase specialized sigma24 family protein
MNFDELICRLRQSDQAAQEEFVRRYRPVVREAAPIRGRNGPVQAFADSEDLSQSVMLKAMRAIKEGLPVQNEEHLRRLLSWMARHRRTDYGRRAQSRPGLVQAESLEERAGAMADGPEGVLLNELEARLTLRQRAVLQAWAEGYTGHETAELLGLMPHVVFAERARIGEAYNDVMDARPGGGHSAA